MKSSSICRYAHGSLAWLIAGCLLLLATACGEEPRAEPERFAPPERAPSDHETLCVNGLYNSGFEAIADGTTVPPKYGAYWVGAFSPMAGVPDDLVEEGPAFRGERFLRLRPDDGPVHQKVVSDPRWTDRTLIILAVRLASDTVLELTLEDGFSHTVTAVFTRPESGTENSGEAEAVLTASWKNGAQRMDGIRLQRPAATDRTGWTVVVIDAGARFTRIHGERPMPRLLVRLNSSGPSTAQADVDDIYAAVNWPAPSASNLARAITERVLWTLETWYLPEKEGGLQLVDPKTGYVTISRYDIETGKNRIPNPYGNLHTVHEVLIRWIAYASACDMTDEARFWTPFLERFVGTLLDRNFDAETHLPRMVHLRNLEPNNEAAVTVGAFIGFLLDAREAISDDALKARCIEAARLIADRLIALQRAHDLPPRRNKNTIRYDSETGKFEGQWPNWFGHIPNRFFPDGSIETPKRFNTAWAILSGRSFWYHFFKSAAGIAAVHRLSPREDDLTAVSRALSLYHRDWDASRYDLENDTDDHYGYLCEDLIRILQESDGALTPALHLVQTATDHRIARGATEPGDTLWIQGVRLGAACAGDSPRAFKGLLDLYALPPSINPASSGLPLYRECLLELARNDLKGRQLTNGQFTESFFKNWEMVCICFRGSYQGDCREHPADYWHGDVGDTFGGPPVSAINAQVAAFTAARRGERRSLLSTMELIRRTTDASLAGRYGYLYGLDPAVARQYELPEKYVMGISNDSPIGVGYVLAWLKVLPELKECPDPILPVLDQLEPVMNGIATGEDLKLRLFGPPGGRVAVTVYRGANPPYPAPLSDTDLRMSAFILPAGWDDPARSTVLDPDGGARVNVSVTDHEFIAVQPILLDPEGDAPLALGEVLEIRGGL